MDLPIPVQALVGLIGMPCITEDGKFVHYSNPCGERVAHLLSRTRQVGNYIQGREKRMVKLVKKDPGKARQNR